MEKILMEGLPENVPIAATVQNLVKMASLMDGNPVPSAIFAKIPRFLCNLHYFCTSLKPENAILRSLRRIFRIGPLKPNSLSLV